MIRRVSTLIHEAESGLHYQQRQPLSAPPKSLLLLLHGVGGTENDLVHLGEAIGKDTLVVYPRGPLDIQGAGSAWFTVNFTANGPDIRFRELLSSRNRLVCLVRELQATYRIAPEQTVIAGFSQGGIMSMAVGLHEPAPVHALACLSGRIPPELEAELRPGKSIRRIQAFLGHGENDEKLPIAWAEGASQVLDRLSVRHVFNRYDSGHELSGPMQDDFIEWANHALNEAT